MDHSTLNINVCTTRIWQTSQTPGLDLSTGSREGGRLGQWVSLPLTYLPYGGLCDQLFGHVQGLALAAQLNATVITSAAWSRGRPTVSRWHRAGSLHQMW